jgi:hypothetical protein
MADKRTTPEAHHGPRRKTRAAPTIDLTATEVPPATVAGEPPPQSDPPPQQPPAQEPPQAGHDAAAAAGKDASADNPSNWPSYWPRNWLNGPIAGLALAGGAGAALVSLVLVGFWLSGLVSIGDGGSAARVAGLEMQLRDLQTRPVAAVDAKSVDALNERVSKIEAAIGKLPSRDPAVAERLAAADNAMKSLGLALAALNRRDDDIAANAAQARERAEAAEKAVTELRTSVQDSVKEIVKDVANNTSGGISTAELEPLQKRIAALEQSAKAARDEIAKAGASDTPARLALSAAGLRDAALSGAPFAAALAAVKSLGADDKALVPLEPFAATGVPNEKALAHELSSLIPAMLKLSGAQAPADGFLDRLQANAGKLVRIRPVDAPPGDDPSAVLARIEIAAAKADIAGALSDLGKLSDATRAPAQGWIKKANARQAALAAARAFAADTTRALGPPLGPPLGPRAGAR